MSRAPEWRQDPLTERLVLISPERAERPLFPGLSCPFCEGHESETPSEVLAFRDPASPPNGPGWRVRVVPNRYGAVRLDAARPGEPAASAAGESARDSDASTLPPGADAAGSPGVGVAEVFIECPHHETKFRNLSPQQIADVLRAWRNRLRFWHEDDRLAFVQIFRNEGAAAGASIEHCHSQLIGVPFVPQTIANEIGHLKKFREFAGVCPYCQWVDAGNRSERFVAESSRFAAFCPTAPRFPGETWLLPKFHIHAFDALADDKLLELSAFLRDLLARLDSVLDNPAFNLIVKVAPFPLNDAVHWRIELLPRTTSIAGWELGTGIFINTMFPEDAAKLLRNAG